MTLHPDELDAARQRWLADLLAAHVRTPSTQSALALARGEWMCGNYDAALHYFREAARRGPEHIESQLGLVRAASMLGAQEIEDAALATARARHPGVPELALHAALRRFGDDPQGALALLAPFSTHPLIEMFVRALSMLGEGVAPQPWDTGHPKLNAFWDSFRWMHRHASRDAFVTRSVDVMMRALAAAPQNGLTIECGVYFGRSLRILATHSPGEVHGFDSFEGLPEAWNADEPAGAYSTAGRLPEHLASNVRLHKGWFQDTLPRFFATAAGPIRLLHIDCDLYSSTRTVLETADSRLLPGSIVLFDDFLGYPGYEQHELRAFEEFVQERNVGWEVVAGCLMGQEVAIRITSR